MESRPLLLEFGSIDALTRAADALRASGLWDTEWYGAAPAHGDEVGVALRPRHLLRAAAIGAAVFAVCGWLLKVAAMVGPFGQGPFAVTLEMALIGAVVSAAAMLLIAAGWREHPLRGLEIAEDPEHDRYFLVLHGAAWQQERVLGLLRANAPLSVHASTHGAARRCAQ